jgi:hypothetical protein
MYIRVCIYMYGHGKLFLKYCFKHKHDFGCLIHHCPLQSICKTAVCILRQLVVCFGVFPDQLIASQLVRNFFALWDLKFTTDHCWLYPEPAECISRCHILFPFPLCADNISVLISHIHRMWPLQFICPDLTSQIILQKGIMNLLLYMYV